MLFETMSSWGVAMTRADGRCVLIKESGGLIWFHEHRCWRGCQVNRSGCKGDIRGVRWKEWGINKRLFRCSGGMVARIST